MICGICRLVSRGALLHSDFFPLLFEMPSIPKEMQHVVKTLIPTMGFIANAAKQSGVGGCSRTKFHFGATCCLHWKIHQTIDMHTHLPLLSHNLKRMPNVKDIEWEMLSKARVKTFAKALGIFKIMSRDLLLIHYLLIIISVFWGSKGDGYLVCGVPSVGSHSDNIQCVEIL